MGPIEVFEHIKQLVPIEPIGPRESPIEPIKPILLNKLLEPLEPFLPIELIGPIEAIGPLKLYSGDQSLICVNSCKVIGKTHGSFRVSLSTQLEFIEIWKSFVGDLDHFPSNWKMEFSASAEDFTL